MNTITEDPFMVGDIPVMPIPVWHLKMPVLGFRFGSFAYITDANRIEEESMDRLRGTSIIVLNALRKEPHVSHFTLSQAVDIAKELQVEKAYFTHISHQLGKHEDVSKELPGFAELGYDGMRIEVDS